MEYVYQVNIYGSSIELQEGANELGKLGFRIISVRSTVGGRVEAVFEKEIKDQTLEILASVTNQQ